MNARSQQDELLDQVKDSIEFLERSASCLTEDDATFKPTEDSMTVAQQLAHIGHTVDWFLQGVFGEGFDLDFEAHAKVILGHDKLAPAMQLARDAHGRLSERLRKATPEELEGPIPPGPIMGGLPRRWVIYALLDHTAHHRGALTVYSRLRGHTPKMPYMEM